MPDIFSDIGVTGLRQSGGYVHEEFLPELREGADLDVYEEMGSNDPVIGSILFGIEMHIRQTAFELQPCENEPDSSEATAALDFISEVFNKMDVGLADILSEVATMFQFGFAPLEIIYKKVDSHVMVSRLSLRAQRSIERWVFDEKTGSPVAAVQRDDFGPRPTITIPMEKMLLFRTTRNKNNPRGRSALRTAYRPWFLKKYIEEYEAIGIERDLAGLPIIKAPLPWFLESASEEERRALAAMEELVKKVKRGQNEGVIFPQSYDEDGNERFTFELLTSGGERQIDVDAVIRRHEQRMAMSVLADWVMLGLERVGTQGLAETKVSMYHIALSAWLDMIADVFNRDLIPRVMKLNGMSVDHAPRFVFANVTEISIIDIITMLKTASEAGLSLVGTEVERFVRDKIGLPAEDPAMEADEYEADDRPDGDEAPGSSRQGVAEVEERAAEEQAEGR